MKEKKTNDHFLNGVMRTILSKRKDEPGNVQNSMTFFWYRLHKFYIREKAENSKKYDSRPSPSGGVPVY